MADLVYERELKHKFNDSIYYVRSLRQDKNLHVEVEQAETGYKWKNQFANTYIEEITSKTGNFKTFDKFCRMIYSALESNNSSVFIDLLTYQDLEILKARKATKSGQEPPSLNATQRTKNKRYLILTYVVEFDRVHYPLALKLDETSIDCNNASIQSSVKSRKQSKNIKHGKSTQKTARKLLAHSITANSSQSSSSASSATSSPQNSSSIAYHQRSNNPKHKHFHSTPNLNADDDAEKDR